MSDADVSTPVAGLSFRCANYYTQINGAAVADDAAAASKTDQKAADLQRATEAGWQKPIPFEYGAAPSEADAGNEPDVPWLSDAVVYEWIDEYGEIGPPDEQLEKQLYEDEAIQQRGYDAGMAAYQAFEIQVEGPEPVLPFREVSLLLSCFVAYH